MGDSLEKRLAELEIKYLLAEEWIESLSATLARQQQELDLLQAQLRLLYQQQGSKEDATATNRSLLDETPPHY